jgi:site-specific recombinase XerD
MFTRWLEHHDAAGTTIARRLSTVAGFYRYCVEEEILTQNPATNVRRPRLRHESTLHFVLIAAAGLIVLATGYAIGVGL